MKSSIVPTVLQARNAPGMFKNAQKSLQNVVGEQVRGLLGFSSIFPPHSSVFIGGHPVASRVLAPYLRPTILSRRTSFRNVPHTCVLFHVSNQHISCGRDTGIARAKKPDLFGINCCGQGLGGPTLFPAGSKSGLSARTIPVSRPQGVY